MNKRILRSSVIAAYFWLRRKQLFPLRTRRTRGRKYLGLKGF
jgi:hypothetical protein